MKNPPFIVDYPVLLNDISIDAKLRSWTLFNYLQDAAGRHADQLGVGLKQLRESDLSWVLSRVRIKMDEFPEYGDVLRVSTYPSGFERLFAYRQFVLTSALTGKRFGVAGSAWLTINPATLRLVSPAKYFTGLPEWDFEGETWFQGETLDKISVDDDAAAPLVQSVYCSQIDYNRHPNNAFYAMFTENWLGKQLDAPARFHEIQINFNQSTAIDETLLCAGTLHEDGRFSVSGTQQNSGKNAFIAQGLCDRVNGAD